MKKEALSKKQQQILDFLKNEINKKGYQPAIREICKAVELSSTATVHSHLCSLEEKGYIKRNPQKNRCIIILDEDIEKNSSINSVDGEEFVFVPVVGKVTAGAPILATEDLTGYLPLPVSMFGNNEGFVLKVRGESMIGAGIFDGDKIFVKKDVNVKNGDIVVALIDDSATVKRYYNEDEFIRLKAENDLYEDIVCREVEIIGKVVGLFREL